MISQCETIWNSGDIQPDGLWAPVGMVLDPGIAPRDFGAAATDVGQTLLTMQSAAGIFPDAPNSAGITTLAGLISAGTVISSQTTFAPLSITPVFGTSIMNLTGTGGDPTASEVEAAINAAIDYYDTNYTSDVPAGTVINGGTVNTVDVSIQFDYGTLNGTAMTKDSGLSQSFYHLTETGNGSFSALKAAVSSALPNLPGSDPTGGGIFLETAAQSQMLGLTNSGGTPDGYVGINSVANGITVDYDLANQSVAGENGAVGAFEHEIAEVFGREAILGSFGQTISAHVTPYYSILDLYRFTAANTPALTAGAVDYFSLNNGTTALGYFNNQAAQGGDAGDWAYIGTHAVPADAFDAFITTGTAGTISNLDTTVLDSLGFRADSLPSGPRILAWTGAQGVDFNTAGNWSDITDSLDPAKAAPGATDTVEFLNGGGSIGGTGSVTVLEFGGQAQWLLGASSTLTASGTTGVTVGGGGDGLVTLTNGATIVSHGSTDIVSGTSPQPAGVTVNGSGSTWTSHGQLQIGNTGPGALSIVAGGTVVIGGGLVVTNTAGSSGSSAEVSGTGSDLAVTGQLDVGVFGSGALSISTGATVTAGSLDAGNIASAVANISVTDALLTIANSATVADDGTGVLSVLSGATFSATNLTIGNTGNSSGAVVVSGSGSVVNISGDLNVGTSLGTGDLTIGPGAVVNAKVVNLQGQVVLENGELDPTVNLINQGQTAGGSGTIAAGDIVDDGVIQAGGSKPSQKLLVVSGTVLGGGPWTINGTAQAQANGGVGVLQINAGGTLELTGPVLNAASTTFTDDLTPQSTYTVTNSVVDVNFADATGVLKLDAIAGFEGTIATVQKGDSFVITGGTLNNLGVSNNNTLTVSDSGNGGTDQLIFASSVSAGGFSIVNSNTIQVACFAEGTRIEAENGPVAVEALACAPSGLIRSLPRHGLGSAFGLHQHDAHNDGTPSPRHDDGGDSTRAPRTGSRVVTVDGRVEPIVSILKRTVNCARHPKPETVWPVRISAGALGEVPSRDLYLSPDHAVFMNGVLVPVKLLINGTTIAQVKRSEVTYYHVELERHEVILAEGLAVESYLDVGDRANFDGTAGTIRLFPDFAARLASDVAAAWETAGCAKLVLRGGQLEAIRDRMNRRNGMALNRCPNTAC
jgi:collagen type I/II/III/V/XI/XXIV/XXVII alpha